MSDYRDLLERERRRFRMPDGSMEELERRRDRKRRNRRIASGLVALIIAVVGIGVGVFALRPTGEGKPAVSPTPSVTPPTGSLGLPTPSGPIQFVDADHGWAVFHGSVFRTQDGGHTWGVAEGAGTRVTSLNFVDATHGWATTETGLLSTSDGGATWTRVSDQTFGTVQFVDSHLGWGVEAPLESNGHLVKTSDGGRTWKFQATGTQGVCAVDDRSVWIVGPGSEGVGGMTVAHSLDGGETWATTRLPVPQVEPWTGTVRCAGTDAWVLIQDGGAAGQQAYAAFGTTDAGTTWTPFLQEGGLSPLGRNRKGVYSEPDPSAGPFAASGSGSAVFVNYCPPCFGSEGATVNATLVSGNPPAVTDHVDFLEPGLPAVPTGLSFLQGGQGWLVLEDSGSGPPAMHIVGTTDGGRTWTSLCRGPTCASP